MRFGNLQGSYTEYSKLARGMKHRGRTCLETCSVARWRVQAFVISPGYFGDEEDRGLQHVAFTGRGNRKRVGRFRFVPPSTACNVPYSSL